MVETSINSYVARKSRFFKNMFFSYCLIILLSFFAYSAMVTFESLNVKKQQATQYYNTKVQAFANAMDQQIYSAQKIVSNINTSSLINKLYLTVRMDRSIDSYLLYQVLNDISSQKAAGDNLNIYDIVLILNDYDKIYTSNEVILLSDFMNFSSNEIKPMAVTNLNQLLSLDNNQLIFYKNYFIYSSKYQYGAGSERGGICVLFESEKMDKLLASAAGEVSGYVVYDHGNAVIESGERGGHTFKQVSRFNPSITYEITADNQMFGFDFHDLGSLALLFGLLICICYLLLAYFFAYRYSSPYVKIQQLVGKGRNDGKNEQEGIVSDVRALVGERNGYMEQVHSIYPYASQGLLHSLIMYNDDEIKKMEYVKNYIELKKMFFLTAVVDLFYTYRSQDRKENAKRIIKDVIELAGKESGDDLKILYYEKDTHHIYLIFNSDNGERLEDRLYEFFEIMQTQLDKDFVITIGADEVRDELSELSRSCENALLALEKILWEGRGFIYFYESSLEFSMNYYFPKDGRKQLNKEIKDRNREGVNHFLKEIQSKNGNEYDHSVFAGQLLLSELYITVVKAIQSVGDQYGLTGRKLDKCPAYRPMDEVIFYYEELVNELLDEVETQGEGREELLNLELELIDYMNQNYKNPDLSLTHISDHFSVSSKYVTTLVKNRFGVTYLKYVQERRIHHAVYLLKTTKLSLEKIAEECGYTNILTFRRNFKSIMETNPSDYRMENVRIEE